MSYVHKNCRNDWCHRYYFDTMYISIYLSIHTYIFYRISCDFWQGVRAIAKEIRHADKIIKSGIITKETKITFRSRSARIIWVVQISTEMWDYTSPYYESTTTESKCQIYFQKFVQFIYRLFEKWRKLEVHNFFSFSFCCVT